MYAHIEPSFPSLCIPNSHNAVHLFISFPSFPLSPVLPRTITHFVTLCISIYLTTIFFVYQRKSDKLSRITMFEPSSLVLVSFLLVHNLLLRCWFALLSPLHILMPAMLVTAALLIPVTFSHHSVTEYTDVVL